MDAKGYTRNQVENLNESLVNKLRKIIKKKRLNFKRFGWFNYHKLMTGPFDGLYDDEVIAKYEELHKQYRHRVNNSDDADNTNIQYIKNDIIYELSQFGYSDEEIADILVSHLYSTDSEAKMILWMCYGHILVENLKKHVNPRETYCRKCGTRFVPKKAGLRYCDSCHDEKNKKKKKKVRRFICMDCGKIVEVPSSARNKKRCDECQQKAKKELTRKRVEKFRLKQNLNKTDAV